MNYSRSHTVGTKRCQNDSAYSYQPLRTFRILTVIACFVLLTVGDSLAWQITSVAPIPAGLTALGTAGDDLWCGYTEDDASIRVYDPVEEQITQELHPPEDVCLGITSNGEAYWFLGEEVIYRLDSEGRVQGRFNRPYENMRGIVHVDDGFWTTVRLGGVVNLAFFDEEGEEITRFRSNMAGLGDLTWDGEHIWVADPIEGVVFEVDPESERTLEAFPSPADEPRGITWFDDHIYLVDEGNEDDDYLIYRINPEAEPTPRILPGSRLYDFGLQYVNTPRQWFLSVFNIGSEELHITSTGMTQRNAGFIAANPPEAGWRIAPGNFVSIRIIFSPGGYGNFRDTLLIESNDPIDGVARVVLTGSGILPFGSLLVSPDSLEFSTVRADPGRDGNRLRQLYLINEGNETIHVDSMHYRLPQVFQMDMPDLPYTLHAADTLTLDFQFTPTRGIRYLDTLMIRTRGTGIITTFIKMRGQGSDSVFAGGSVLWEHRLEDGPEGFGTATRLGDVNNDDIGDVVAVGPSGIVYCLNGFGSFEVDVIWRQEFNNLGYRPAQVVAEGGIAADRDLNGDGLPDVILASGGEDRAVYALSGNDGSLIWRWEARSVNQTVLPRRLVTRNDFNGDGVADPAVLLTDDENRSSVICLLDGTTGRSEWSRNLEATNILEIIPDRDRNGAPEFVTVTSQNTLLLYNGINGRIMERIDLGGNRSIAHLVATEDLDDDNIGDILLSTEAGGIIGYSISREEELWHFDFGLGGPGERYGALTTMRREESGLMFGTASGYIGVIDPMNGEPVWIVEDVEIPTTAAFLSDLSGDNIAEIVVGYDSGLLECRDGSDGDTIWTFPGDELDVGSVGHLEIMDDVDRGGSSDVLAIFDDGIVRCISSYGDIAGIINHGTDLLPIEGRFIIAPNPFNADAKLTFELPRSTSVRINIFDGLGRSVGGRDVGLLPSGVNVVSVGSLTNGQLPTGIYYFVLKSNNETMIRRGVFLR